MSEVFDVKIGAEEWDFVPRFGAGKITCKLKQLTVEEMDDCFDLFAPDPAKQINRPKVVAYGLKKISGLTVGGKPVKDATELMAAPKVLQTLFIEIWMEINKGSKVTATEKKTS